MNNFLRNLVCSLMLVVCLLAPALALADSATGQMSSDQRLEAIRKQAKDQLNQLPSLTVQDIIGQAIRILMAFMGAIMFLLVVYAGLMWMTAGGNSDKIDQAKRIIVWSTLGIFVMLASYVIVSFVFKQLQVT